MGLYEPFQHLGMWKDIYPTDNDSYASASLIVDVDARPENKVNTYIYIYKAFVFSYLVLLGLGVTQVVFGV